MDKIGRFAAGKYWRRMSDTQKAEYQLCLKSSSENVLNTLWGYAGEKVDVKGTIKAGQSDVFVRTNITGERGRKLKVDWRVRRINDR